MKSVIKNIIAASADHPIARRAYEGCGARGHYLSQVRGHARFVRENTHLEQELIHLARSLFPDLEVQKGPFRGLRYPSLASVGSALLPKLLGSYESGLHPYFREFSENPYDHIVDIGCAEGYYAVGSALLWPTAMVYAFDIDSSATKACQQMATLHGVADRVRVESACHDETSRSLPLGSRALIISDCEGYEKNTVLRMLGETPLET